MLILNSNFVRQQLILHARGSASFDIRDKVLEEVWVPKKIMSDLKTQQEMLAAIESREHFQQLLNEADSRLTKLMEVFSE